jgi:hypothetical protein
MEDNQIPTLIEDTFNQISEPEREDAFFKDVKITFWRQKWERYTPHQTQVILQPLLQTNKNDHA